MDNENSTRDERAARQMRPALIAIGLILLALVVVLPLLDTNAAPFAQATFQSSPSPVSFMPVIFKDYPASPTTTATLTATTTLTPTLTTTPPTITRTASFTFTATRTETGTPRTPTPTRTISLTPTVTRTGTITPAPTISVSADPTQGSVNTIITFIVNLTNTGLAPANDTVVTDSFPSYVDVLTVSSNKGTTTKAAHSWTASIGQLFPNENVRISIDVKLNAGATKNETIANVVTMTYAPNKSLTASVNYTIKATGLPGTGELPIEPEATTVIDWSLLFLGATLGLIGLFTIWYGLWARKRQPRLSEWCLGIGVVLIAGAVLVSIFGLGRVGPQEVVTPPTPQEALPTLEQLAGFGIAPDFTPTRQHPSAAAFSTPEPLITLPNFPIPSPTFLPTPVNTEEPLPDASAVMRVIISKLSLDAVVKYVPYEEETWLINGLREEVAWLGNTSWPGLGGNTALAAHVTVRGLGDGPFRYLDQLTAGDEIVIFTERYIYTYRVRENLVVNTDETWVTEPTENTQLTLITCTDWDLEIEAYLKRLVVFADLEKAEPIRRGGR